MDSESTLKNIQEPVRDAASPFDIGQLLVGKYEILSFLGKGGMGSVYRVKHVLLGVELALKTLDTQHVGDAASLRRFQTEARAAFSLKHPNLVKVHDSGVLENKHPFLVMDLVKGRTLQSLIKERGHLSLSEVESIFVQLCFGLTHAHHQSVVHRDIKPANIMLVDGLSLKEEGSVKILDFGIAKLVNQDRGEMEALTMTGEIFGSPLYMSPEQCSGASIDQRSDVYSLGCVLFEALTGTTPMVGSNPLRTMMLHVNEAPPSLKEAALGTEFPEALESIVAKMLAKDPKDRYTDLGIVALELCKACTGTEHQSDQPTQSDTKQGAVKNAAAAAITFTVPNLVLLLSAIALLSVLATRLLEQQFLVGSEVSPPIAPPVAPPAASPDKSAASSEEDKVSPEKERDIMTDLNDALSKTNDYARAKMRGSFDKVDKITRKIVVKNGQQYLQINFPNMKLGQVIYFRNGVVDLPAQGILTIPLQDGIALEVSDERTPGILLNTAVFDKVDPGIFSRLIIGGAGDSKVLRLSQDGYDLHKAESLGTERVLSAATGWKLLNSLKFSNLRLTEDMFKSINRMPKLRGVELEKSEFDPAVLARQKFLETIDGLAMDNGDVDVVLKAVSSSPSIKFLHVAKQCEVSPEAIESLNKNKQLMQINLGLNSLTDSQVKAVCDLSQISYISFQKEAVTESHLAEISKKWTLFAQQKPIMPIPQDYLIFKRKP